MNVFPNSIVKFILYDLDIIQDDAPSTVVTCIQKVPGLSVGQDSIYSDTGLTWFSVVLQIKLCDSTLSWAIRAFYQIIFNSVLAVILSFNDMHDSDNLSYQQNR